MRSSPILALALLLPLLASPAFGAPADDPRPIVPASEILAKIERGEPVEYDGVIVVGDLDLSGLDLPTKHVERTKFDEEVMVVESLIHITNSEIRGDVDFSDIIFQQQVIFSDPVSKNNIYLEIPQPYKEIPSEEILFDGSIFPPFEILPKIGTSGGSQTQFSGYADFSGAQFSHGASFLAAQFSGKADFRWAQFDGEADFCEAQFSGYADFREAQFSSYAWFFVTQFDGAADFTWAQFSSYAWFYEAQFGGAADFTCAQFDGKANFEAQFDGEVDFRWAQFSSYARFYEAQFGGGASFRWAQFDGAAYFTGSQFNSYASFIGAQFSDDAYFTWAQFNGDAGFGRANFSDDAEFREADFSGDAVSFEDSSFYHANLTLEDAKNIRILRLSNSAFENESAICLNGTEYERLYVRWDSIESALVYNGEVYLTLVKNFKTVEYFEDADDCYYQYRRERQSMRSWFEVATYTDIFGWVTCGYGVRPGYTLLLGLFVVLVSAVYYWRRDAIRRLKGDEDESAKFSDAFYFSMMTFTTVGYGDWYPLDRHRNVVMIEGIVGWLTLSLFLVTLANVIIR